MRRAHLSSRNLKRTVFRKPSEDAKPKVNVLRQCPLSLASLFCSGSTRIVPAMLCKALDSIVGGINDGSG